MNFGKEPRERNLKCQAGNGLGRKPRREESHEAEDDNPKQVVLFCYSCWFSPVAAEKWAGVILPLLSPARLATGV
jgi:hypothetical protein